MWLKEHGFINPLNRSFTLRHCHRSVRHLWLPYNNAKEAAYWMIMHACLRVRNDVVPLSSIPLSLTYVLLYDVETCGLSR